VTKIFPVKPNEVRETRAVYRQVLRKDSGLLRLTLPLSVSRLSAEPVAEVSVGIDIAAGEDIKNIYSPSHAPTVTRKGDRKAAIAWQAKKVRTDRDFEIFWAVDDRELGLNLLTFRPAKDQPGTFLLFASPRVTPVAGLVEPKDVVFVLDRSGSMRIDGKMKQACDALAFGVANLNPEDRFTVATFSNAVELFDEKLQEATAAAKRAALDRIAKTDALGGTALHDALLTAMRVLSDGTNRLKIIVLVTDGQPTIGERDARKIARDVRCANPGRTRLFAFGLGYDVNTTFLDGLARDNRGDSEYVKPGDALETRLATFFAKIRNPILSDLQLAFSGVTARDQQPSVLPDLFTGGQLVAAGRYEGSGPARITLSGMSQGRPQQYAYDVFFEEQSVGDSMAFVESVWATRQIGHLIDEIHLRGATKELVDEVVRLSVRHGILTEYTAFLVLEDVDLKNNYANNEQALKNLNDLRNDVGARAVNQAENKKQCQEAGQQRDNRWNNEKGEEIVIQACRNVGRRTFFQKQRMWVDVQAEAKEPAEEVAYFSDAFFKMLDERPDLNRVAALGGDILVRDGSKQIRLKR